MLNVVHSFKNNDEVIQYYDNRSLEISSNEFGVHDFSLRLADGLRTQQHFTIHFVLQGEGTFSLAGKIYHLKENDIFFTPPNVLVSTQPDKENPWKYFWIGINGKGFKEIIQQLATTEDPIIHLENADPIRNIIQNLLDFYPATKTAIRLKALSVVFDILSILQRDRDAKLLAQPSLNGSEVYHQKAIDLIEENYNNCDFQISDICNSLAISHSYLCKIFKKYSNTSANAFLIEIRMREARVLLERDNSSIQEIAKKVGYDDFAYFSREFRRLFGMSAKDYRALQQTKR